MAASGAFLLVTACEESTTPGDDAVDARSPGRSDGGAGSGEPSGYQGEDPDHDPFNGIDAGCPVTVVGPRSGRAAASVARSGAGSGVAWANAESAIAADGDVARALLAPEATTELLRVTDYGFDVPATARILGVEVQLKRQGSDQGVADGTIELWLDGKPSERPKLIATSWPRTIIGTHHYGQAVDSWGDDLTPELVGRSGFGVELWAKRLAGSGEAPVEARVDALRMTLFYCN